MTSRLISLYGSDEPIEEETALIAGPLTAIFSCGVVRSISLLGVEVIQDISFLVRDRNWATTAASEIRGLAIEQGDVRFDVSLSAGCRTPSDDQSLLWRGRVAGAAEGLSFEADARPDQDLHTCRTGFVVTRPSSGSSGSRDCGRRGCPCSTSTGRPPRVRCRAPTASGLYQYAVARVTR
jgi:D-apionolactonase